MLTRESRQHLLSSLTPLVSLRYFAAAYIVLAHSYKWGFNWTELTEPAWTSHIFNLAYALVGLFVVLSGFTLSCVYLTDYRGSFPTRRFLVARFARLYPVYLLGIALDAPRVLHDLSWHGHVAWGKLLVTLAGTLLMVQAWAPSHLLFWDTANWFIAAEILFIVLFPWLGLWLWRLRRRSAVALTCVLLVVPVLLAIVGLHWPGVHLDTPTLYFFPLAHTHEFMIGVLLARYFVYRNAEGGKGNFSLLTLLGVFLLFAVPVYACMTLLPLRTYRLTLQFGGLFPVYAALIFLLCGGYRLLDRVLRNPRVVRFAETNYSLYLLHLPLSSYTRIRAHHSLPLWIGYLVTCVVVSMLSLRYFEAPARRWILDRTHARQRESMAVASTT